MVDISQNPVSDGEKDGVVFLYILPALLQLQYSWGTPASWQVLLVTSENRDTPAWVFLSLNRSLLDLPTDRARMSCNIRWTSKLDVRNFEFFTRFCDENII